MGRVNLMGGTVSLPVIDCRSYRIRVSSPQCDLGRDLASCATCDGRSPRNGDLRNPPLFVVTGIEDPKREESKQGLRGMGDVVAAVTKAVGIKPCQSCRKRQEALNRAMPFPGSSGPAAPPEST